MKRGDENNMSHIFHYTSHFFFFCFLHLKNCLFPFTFTLLLFLTVATPYSHYLLISHFSMCLFLSLSTSPTLSLLSISIVDLIKIECRSVKVLTFYKLEMHYIVPKFKFIFRMYFFCPRLKITSVPNFCYHSSICMAL